MTQTLNVQIQTTAASHCVYQRITTAQNLQLHSNQITTSTTHSTSTIDTHPPHPPRQQQQQQQRRRPILYLHPGPAKTTTSTLQYLLIQYQDRLAADYIFLLGTLPRDQWHCDFPHPAFCLLQVKTQLLQYRHRIPRECQRVIHAQLEEYYHHGVDIVLTSELLGLYFAQGQRGKQKLQKWFREVVEKNAWDIRVLIGYRPYFDFALSGFNQQFKNRKRPKLQRWPSEGGWRIPLVKTGVLEVLEGKAKLLVEFPFTDVLVELFRPYADRVEVYDITTAPHNNNNNNSIDFTEHFFCEMLEGADGACLAQRAVLVSSSSSSETGTEIHKNRAESLNYDRLATAAADRGLINVTASPKLQRGWVGQQIRAYLLKDTYNHHQLPTNVTGNGTITMTKLTEWPPLVCPTSEADRTALERLYTISLTHEQHLFPSHDPHW